MIGVYKITNQNNGNFYVGASKDIQKRWKKHKQVGIHSKLFESDIAEHGWKSFDFDVIEECGIEDLREREAHYIGVLNPPYNSIVRGKARDESTRKKISQKLTGKTQSEETKQKRRDSIRKRHEVFPQTNEGHRKKVLVDGREFISVMDAAEYLGIDASYLSKMHGKGRTTYKGHTVRYVV